MCLGYAARTRYFVLTFSALVDRPLQPPPDEQPSFSVDLLVVGVGISLVLTHRRTTVLVLV